MMLYAVAGIMSCSDIIRTMILICHPPTQHSWSTRTFIITIKLITMPDYEIVINVAMLILNIYLI